MEEYAKIIERKFIADTAMPNFASLIPYKWYISWVINFVNFVFQKNYAQKNE